MTIKQYAREKGVSYEAIRKQIAHYRDELGDHVQKKNRTMILDDVAIEFLDGKRRENPVIVIAEDERERVERMREEIDALKNELMTTQKRVIELQTQNQLMIEAKNKYDLLLENNTEKQATIDALREDLKEAKDDARISRQAIDAARDQRDEARKEADAIRRERDEAREEARSYRKSIFGFYRKTK